jgi:chemotaxis protein methyltransferase CheR
VPTRDRAVDQVLQLVEDRLGLGYRGAAPGWVRDRVLGVLQEQARRSSVALSEAAARLRTDPPALEEVIAALRVGETRFYRDRAHWEALARDVVPAFPAGVTLQALSAGCSTGEEAYTLAMLLTTARRRFHVLGVDRAAPAVAAAQAATYDADAARDLPSDWLARFFDAGARGLTVRSSVRDLVSFEQGDLVKRTPRGPFHLIFFKNVLLYLSAPAGEALAARLAGELDEHGLLFVASSEVARVRAAGLRPVRLAPGITAFRQARHAPGARAGGRAPWSEDEDEEKGD